jgi:SPFH domain / Band 7 family
MGVVVLCAILGLVAVGCVIWGAAAKQPLAYLAAAVSVVIAGLILILSSLTTVGPSDVGIETAFGHTVGNDLGPGLHWVAPWDGVTIWDDSVQRTAFEGKDCLNIRIAGQQSACLDVIVFWKDKPSASDAQFRQFRTFPRVEAAYFSRGVVTKFYNNVFESYDPVALASQTTKAGQQGGITVSTLTKNVLANIQGAYADTADVISLNSGQIRYDQQVESALSSVVKAKASYNVALQNKATALAQSTANGYLAKAGTLTGPVVMQNCLNITQTIIQAGGHMPPAWTCGGAGAGLLVNAGK